MLGLLICGQLHYIVMKNKKLKVYTSFSSKKQVQLEETTKTDGQTTEIQTQTSESLGVEPPQFINEIQREWPSWSRVKQETGIYRPPPIRMQNGQIAEYVKAREIPLPKCLSRGQCRYYKYYVDQHDGVTYFYPYSRVCPEEYYEQMEHMPKEQQLYSYLYLAGEGITIVPSSIALPEIQNTRRRIKNYEIKFEKVGNWTFAY